MFANVYADVRFALRQVGRSPGFAVVAVLTLALGIGANTAIFSLLDQALLRGLPVRASQELVQLKGTGDVWEGSTSGNGGTSDEYFSFPMYRDLRDRDNAFAGLIASARRQADFTQRGESRVIQVELVSGNYFTVLGTPAALGRTLLPSDDTESDPHPVTVLSYDFWRNVLNSDHAVVNSTVTLNGRSFLVVGVAAPGFHSAVWGETPELFVPVSLVPLISPAITARSAGRDRSLEAHTFRWLNIVGRLRPGETAAAAQGQSAPLWYALRAEELKALHESSPHFIDAFLTRSRLLVIPAPGGVGYNREQLRRPLVAVMAMAALVLLIAVINVGSLLLVRSSSRVREFSMRSALGASSRRILAQLLAEGLLIGAAGALAGLLLAPLAIRALLLRLADSSGAAPFTPGMDGRVLAFTALVAMFFSLLFSLAPALQLRRRNLALGMRGTASTGTGAVLSLRRLIVGLQFGLSLLLLVSAGLFVRTLRELRTRDVGFRTDHLLVFGLSPELAGYRPERIPALRRQLEDTLRTIPGVTALGVTNDPELAGNDHTGDVNFQNYTPPPDTDINVEEANVDPGYFAAMPIPLIAGRGFTAEDDATHPLVAVIDAGLATHLFGAPQRALGQRFQSGVHPGRPFDLEVVGVVAEHMHVDLHQGASAQVYRPLAQADSRDANRELFFYLRSSLPPDVLSSTVRQRVQAVDSTLAVDSLRSMAEQVDTMLSNERLIALLAGSFGVLAGLLAGVGLYGVLAFVTAARTREIGVRMALGASRLLVSRMVFSDVLRMVSGGVLVGVPAALVLARLLRSQLYGVSPADPLSLGTAALILTAVALLAAALPARRAVLVDPTQALKSE